MSKIYIKCRYTISEFDKNTTVHVGNSLGNLHTLWAKDNLSKVNKIIEQ